jgi:hypothetical protein
MITPAFGITATERVLPKLSLDFTTASLDTRITFTRFAATATRVNSSGYIETVAADTPRFDFNPVTLVCRGLLIEEQRTNLLLRSEQFNDAAWAKTNASITANTIVAPDGALTGDKFVENSSSGVHFISQTPTITAGTAYTFSVYAKAAERNLLQLGFDDGSANGVFAMFNVSAGTISVAATARGTGTAIGATITAVGNGWFRCVLSGTAGPSATTSRCAFVTSTGASTWAPSYTGDGTSGIYIWGAQLEAGAFATSYILTTITAVTRNADVATMTGTNFSDWYSAGAGGVVARVLPSTVSGTRPALQFDDATADEVITLRGSTTNPELVIVDGGSPQAQIDAGTIAANTAYNLGAAWATDDCAAAVNGGAAVTDTTATIPTVTQARLGSDGTNYLNGHLQTLRYWPQRLINAEVQAFSK